MQRRLREVSYSYRCFGPTNLPRAICDECSVDSANFIQQARTHMKPARGVCKAWLNIVSLNSTSSLFEQHFNNVILPQTTPSNKQSGREWRSLLVVQKLCHARAVRAHACEGWRCRTYEAQVTIACWCKCCHRIDKHSCI